MEELARLILLVLAVVLVINLIQGGPQRVSRWLGAKFLGRDDRAAANAAEAT